MDMHWSNEHSGKAPDSATELSASDKTAGRSVLHLQKASAQFSLALNRTHTSKQKEKLRFCWNKVRWFLSEYLYQPGDWVFFVKLLRIYFVYRRHNVLTEAVRCNLSQDHINSGEDILPVIRKQGDSEQSLRWGLLVVSHPWLVILFSLLLCGGLSGGLLFWQQETDQELLWTPYGSPVRFVVTLNCHK